MDDYPVKRCWSDNLLLERKITLDVYLEYAFGADEVLHVRTFLLAPACDFEYMVQAFWPWAQQHQANELRHMFMAIRGGSGTLAKSRGSLSGPRGCREVIGYLQVRFKEGYVWDV